MANEAKLIQDLEYKQLEVTMADGSSGTDIEQFTILQLGDPNTGTASSGDNQTFLGILAVENVGGDGQTRYAVYRGGVWDIKLTSATVAVGNFVKIAGTNLVADADDAGVMGANENVGMALQTGANDEVIEILVGNSV